MTRESKIKVIHIITRMDFGGAQQNTLHTCRTLDRERFECLLISGSGGYLDEETRRGAGSKGVRFLPDLVHSISPPQDFLAFLELVHILLEEKPAIVHTHSSKAGILGRLAAWAAGVPVIIHTFHGFGFNEFQPLWLKALYVWAERIAGAVSDSLVFVSRSNQEYAKAHSLGREERYELIRSGVPLQVYEEKRSPKVFRDNERFQIPPDRLLVTAIGNFKAQKNPLDFVRMAAKVTDHSRNGHFLFIGEGPLKDDVLRLCAESGILDRFDVPGWRKDIPDILAATDIFVLTSSWEGLPRSLVEAMKAGIPPVCYAADGIAEMIEDGKNGFLVPIGDVTLLSERVAQLLKDSSLRDRLGKAAAASIGDEFDIDAMVRSQEKLYLKLAKFV